MFEVIPPTSWPSDDDTPVGHIDDFVERLARHGVEATGQALRATDAATALVEQTTRLTDPLLVMASPRWEGDQTHWFVTVRQVVARATGPVLVVPSDRRDDRRLYAVRDPDAVADPARRSLEGGATGVGRRIPPPLPIHDLEATTGDLDGFDAHEAVLRCGVPREERQVECVEQVLEALHLDGVALDDDAPGLAGVGVVAIDLERDASVRAPTRRASCPPPCGRRSRRDRPRS